MSADVLLRAELKDFGHELHLSFDVANEGRRVRDNVVLPTSGSALAISEKLELMAEKIRRVAGVTK